MALAVGIAVDADDPPYPVPDHLRQPEAMGPIPMRTFWVGFGALVVAVVAAFVGRAAYGPLGMLAGVPVWPALTLALGTTWFDPRPEHGLAMFGAFAYRLVGQQFPWLHLPPLDQLRQAGLHPVRIWRVLYRYRKTASLGPGDLPELAGLRVDDVVVWVPIGDRLEPRAIFRMPTLNLSAASASARRAARAQWGGIVNTLPHPIQVVCRCLPVVEVPSVDRGLLPQAHRLALWLTAHFRDDQYVSRERFLVVPADNLEVLETRCRRLEKAFAKIGLPLRRVVGETQLRAVLLPFLTPRPAASGRLGPGRVDELVDAVVVDGEFVRSWDLGKLPPTMVTNWGEELFDADLRADWSLDIEPMDLAWAKLRLDARRNSLESSGRSVGREVALRQVVGLRLAYEERKTMPRKLTCTVVVRANSLAQLKQRTTWLQDRAQDLGIGLRLLLWEQRAGWLAVAPLRRGPLWQRGHPVETGTVARTHPFASGTLAMAGGVPFGVAGSAPVAFSVVQPRGSARKGWRHMCWYGSTGSGKSYGCKCYLSRERFANGLRVYGIDQDPDQEFAGRFCTYIGGTRVPIRTVEDAERFSFAEVATPDVVFWDLHECLPELRGEVFARLKATLCAWLLATRGRAALVVDEAVTVTRQKAGSNALYDLTTQGRHYGLELHTLTQLATSWFGTEIGRAVQNTSANQWYGQLEDREREEMVAAGVKLSAEELRLIDGAGQGEGLLVTSGRRRVWLSLFGHTSPEEFAAFNTDREDDDEDDADPAVEPGEAGRRNGHVSVVEFAGRA